MPLEFPRHVAAGGTGSAEPWKDLAPADTTGLTNVGVRAITPDGRFYAYNCAWLFSDLFLVEGVR